MFNQFLQMASNYVPSTNTQHHGKDSSKIPQNYKISNKNIQQISLLSEGAFGFIWKAEDTITKEQYALKRVICMNKQRLQAAIHEKVVMSKLPQNPHLVKFYAGQVIKRQTNTTVVTLMQLCPGGTLFDMLQKRINTGFTQNELLVICLSILKALYAIHNTGYYHRDIKIENVILGKDLKFKLCDFGSCTDKIVDFATISKSDYNDYLQEIQSFTTPMYRAPQMVDPYLKYQVAHKSDVWMLGCVLYTLCYFVHPFVDCNAVGIASAAFRLPSQPKFKISQKINDLIRLMLTPNPKNRPQVVELINIIAKWDTITEINLNQQAKDLKIQYQKRERQFEMCGKKKVDFDGDIPLDKLMQLQNKLKNKSQSNQKVTSFINDKQTKKISQKHLYNSNNTNNHNNSNNINKIGHSQTTFQTFRAQSIVPQQKKIIGIKENDFWEYSQPIEKSSNSFEVFNTLLQENPPSNNISQQKQVKQVTNTNNNGNNFMEFFQQTPSVNDIQQKSKKNISQNLLDF